MGHERVHGGHYSEGQDRMPDNEAKRHTGRWSEGLARFHERDTHRRPWWSGRTPTRRARQESRF